MKILLDLDGWEKEIDIPSYIAGRRYVEAVLHKPLNVLANREAKPINTTTNVLFVYHGKRRNNLPVYQYEI